MKLTQSIKNFFDQTNKTKVAIVALMVLSVALLLIQPTYNYFFNKPTSVISNKYNQEFLVRLNNTYFPKFVSTTGQTLDDQTKTTTSEGQAYTMLRALYGNDKAIFDRSWKWTIDNLQVRENDKLLSWKYTNGKVQDKEAATDADLDIAYALIRASEKWSDPTYLEQAKTLVNDIYNHRVREYNGLSMLLPFSSNSNKGFEIINISYFSPAYYKKFASIDSAHNWPKLVDDTYSMLDKISSSRVLFPDWIRYNIDSNTYTSAADFMQNPNADNFSYDAMRVYWRLGYDYVENRDKKAFDILSRFTPFLEQEANRGTFYTSYSPKGVKAINYDTPAMNSMIAIPLILTNSKSTNRIWQDKIIKTTDYNKAIFQSNEVYYNQNMAWFAYYINNRYVELDKK
jgi:endoglucanase